MVEKENYITEVDILDEAKDNFLTYASEVLTDRAIPAAEDGLLSAQRKLLWTMEEYLKMDAKSKTKKCNAIVGSTLATSYFHGDQACYGVLCKMAQEYLMRYPLIAGQGSLGTQENNDIVASSRYTEAKPSSFADLMMNDYKKNVVPKKETYNGEFMEPVVLPGLFPNAICNGRQAIGISMAHCTAPHNLTEVCNAIIAYIQKGNLTIDELMEYIKGPDFPLPNTVINAKDIRTAFQTGKSSTSLKIRGEYEIDGNKIIFTSIPYRTYRNKIKEQIAKNVDTLEKVIDDFSDESALMNNRLIFTVKPGVSAQEAVNKLFSCTDLQTTLSYNMTYIVNGTPKVCSMVDLIKAYVEHQTEVLLNATNFDKDKAEKKLHILNGLLLAIDKIDTVISLIRSSENKSAAREGLIKLLNIDEVQANAILDMKLSRLTKMDKEELLADIKEQENIIAYCNNIIENKDFRNNILIEKIQAMKNKYGDARRTKLENITVPKEKKEEVYIEPEKCVVVMTESGNVKRIPATSFRAQSRNTKGVKTQDDITSAVIRTNTVDNLMVFSDKGMMYKVTVNDIPVGTNISKGVSIKGLTAMESDEHPVTMYSVYKDTTAKYVLFVTANGLIKKTSLAEFIDTKKKNGIGAIKFREGDSLAAVTLVDAEDIILVTKNGMAIKFSSTEVSPTGRLTMGVKGITLNEGDKVIAALPVHDQEDELAIFTNDGYGKRISKNEISIQKRGGKGVICYKGNSYVAAAQLLNDKDQVLIVGNKNSVFLNATEIPTQGRTTTGNTMIKDNNILTVSKV